MEKYITFAKIGFGLIAFIAIMLLINIVLLTTMRNSLNNLMDKPTVLLKDAEGNSHLITIGTKGILMEGK